MIYQLLKRDPAWKLMPLAAAGGGLCMLVSSGRTEAMFVGTLLYALLTFAELRRRATLFEAALPIPARDLLAARCVALAALVWLPVLAAVGVALVKGATVLGPIDCGAGASLLLIAVLSVRLAEMESPLPIVALLLGLGTGLCVLAFSLLPAALVLTFCAMASAALCLRAWSALPESFQAAPLKAQKPFRHRLDRKAPAIPWLVLLRSAVPIRNFLFLPMICQSIFMHPASWPTVCCFGVFGCGLGQPHTRWLWTLPVSRRKLLAIAAAVATLFSTIPYSISAALGRGGHTSLRLGLINLVCMMFVCMIGLILLVAWGSYRIRLLPMWFRSGVFLPLMVAWLLGPAIAEISLGHAAGDRFLENFMLQLSQRLPANPAAILLLGALAFAALFRLLEKLDAQAEWPETLNRQETGQITLLRLN